MRVGGVGHIISGGSRYWYDLEHKELTVLAAAKAGLNDS